VGEPEATIPLLLRIVAGPAARDAPLLAPARRLARRCWPRLGEEEGTPLVLDPLAYFLNPLLRWPRRRSLRIVSRPAASPC